MSDQTRPLDGNAPLSVGQWLALVMIGAVLWLLVIFLLRAVGAFGGYSTMGTVIFYLALIPGTVPLILATRKIVRLRANQMLEAVAIVTASASLLDGVALAAMPSFYGTNPLGASAALLWGVGVALFLGVLMNRSGPEQF